jgi:hypothetical protein
MNDIWGFGYHPSWYLTPWDLKTILDIKDVVSNSNIRVSNWVRFLVRLGFVGSHLACFSFSSCS